MDIKVYQDGKRCRDIPAEIVGRRAQGLLIRFEEEEFVSGRWLPVTVTCWFNRVRKCGAYECMDWNYFYYSKGV